MERLRRHRHERGASLVEFALILPVFAMLLFGMITAGLALNEKQQMTHATREGARYAATVPAGQTFDSGTWDSNVEAVLRERSVDTLENAEAVCVALVQGSAGHATYPLQVIHSNQPADAACLPTQTYPVSSSDSGRRVQIWARKPATIDLVLFGEFTVNLYAEATSRSETSA